MDFTVFKIISVAAYVRLGIHHLSEKMAGSHDTANAILLKLNGAQIDMWIAELEGRFMPGLVE